jgi:Tol biopolymer transport system component
MGIVTTDEGRGQSRDVYFAPGERSMVHHSYLSPDSRWVVAVVMNNQGTLIPCRLLPFDGSARERAIGPPDAVCSSAAWSLDGKWIYLTSNKGGRSHIWRQRFPDGAPEQLTSGPTEEDNIAMAPDGKSLLTSVGVQDSTIWIHDAKGDRQLSSEGNAFDTSFSQDGRKLYYLMQSGQSSKIELWVTELATGKNERLLPGYDIFSSFRLQDYSVSSDDKQIAFAMKDQNGVNHLWLATTNHRSSPRQLPSADNEDSPAFLSNGDLIFRGTENGLNFLYRIKPDGTGRRKISPTPILDLQALSPDGRWAIVTNQVTDEDHLVRVSAFPVEGGPPVRLCATICRVGWDLHGALFHLSASAGGDLHTYLLPLTTRGLPDLPADGITGGDDLKSLRKVSVLPSPIDSAIDLDTYSYTRYTTRRNIYRIPLP